MTSETAASRSERDGLQAQCNALELELHAVQHNLDANRKAASGTSAPVVQLPLPSGVPQSSGSSSSSCSGSVKRQRLGVNN